MNKEHRLAFFAIGFLAITLFAGGIIGIIFLLNRYNNIRKLKRSGVVENAVITNLRKRGGRRSTSDTFFFTTLSDGKVYRFSTMQIPLRIVVGDEIEVIFNEDRSLFFITTYSRNFHIDYIVNIAWSALCLILGIYLLYAIVPNL